MADRIILYFSRNINRWPGTHASVRWAMGHLQGDTASTAAARKANFLNILRSRLLFTNKADNKKCRPPQNSKNTWCQWVPGSRADVPPTYGLLVGGQLTRRVEIIAEKLLRKTWLSLMQTKFKTRMLLLGEPLFVPEKKLLFHARKNRSEGRSNMS